MRPYVLALLCLPILTLPARAQWQLHDAHTTADLRGIDNVGNGVAWASGTDGTILRTLDNGEHWQLCSKPPNAEHLDFRAIQAFDKRHSLRLLGPIRADLPPDIAGVVSRAEVVQP